jgi:hypothetical protein
VEGELEPGERDLYTVRALDGQSAGIVLRSPQPGLIMAVGGAVNAPTQGYRWQGITTGGVLTVEVFSPEGFGGGYRLDVIILPVGEAGIPMVAAEERCFMIIQADAEILFVPSADSEVFSTGEAVAGEAIEVAAVTPTDDFYALFPGAAQAPQTGSNALRWVRARDATLDGMCAYVDEISLADVQADSRLDALPLCEVSFSEEQPYNAQPNGAPLGSFAAGEGALAYAVTAESIGVMPPTPRYGRYGLDRLVWVPLTATTLQEDPACADLEQVDYP